MRKYRNERLTIHLPSSRPLPRRPLLAAPRRVRRPVSLCCSGRLRFFPAHRRRWNGDPTAPPSFSSSVPPSLQHATCYPGTVAAPARSQSASATFPSAQAAPAVLDALGAQIAFFSAALPVAVASFARWPHVAPQQPPFPPAGGAAAARWRVARATAALLGAFRSLCAAPVVCSRKGGVLGKCCADLWLHAPADPQR